MKIYIQVLLILARPWVLHRRPLLGHIKPRAILREYRDTTALEFNVRPRQPSRYLNVVGAWTRISLCEVLDGGALRSFGPEAVFYRVPVNLVVLVVVVCPWPWHRLINRRIFFEVNSFVKLPANPKANGIAFGGLSEDGSCIVPLGGGGVIPLLRIDNVLYSVAHPHARGSFALSVLQIVKTSLASIASRKCK
jgi:hypothetical protein